MVIVNHVFIFLFCMVHNNKKPILVMTGATGYLGSAIVRSLIDLDIYKVIILKRSFSNTFRIDELLKSVTVYNIDEISVEKVFEENAIDIILHCATDYGRKSINPMQIVEANLMLPVKLLECGRKNNVKVFVNTDTILDKRINHYSLSKKQFRDWLLSYKSSLVCVNVELGHFYGPGDDKTKFVSYILDLLLRNVSHIDLTPGEQRRDFVYIEDVVEVFLKIINHSKALPSGFYEYQVCSGQESTIKDLVLLIRELTGNTSTQLRFGALPYRENEVMVFEADNTRVKELGWQAYYTLQKGLQKMVDQEMVYTNKTI